MIGGGSREIAAFLVEEGGAQVNAKNAVERTPLHFAAQSGRADIGTYLIKHGADLNMQDSLGWTPRWFICNACLQHYFLRIVFSTL